MPYSFVLDEVTVEYLADVGCYNVVFRKRIRASASGAVASVYARIMVNVMPDDPELSRQYYRQNPVRLEDLGFVASDSLGNKLCWTVLTAYDANVEIELRVCDARGRERPLPPNDEFEFSYRFRVSDRQWGPYIERHVRFATETAAIRLLFPRGSARVFHAERPPGADWKASRSLQPLRSLETRDYFEMRVERPGIQHRIRLSWRFCDRREVELVDEFRTTATHGNTHTADFRSVLWNGETYALSPTQARCVELLWVATDRGCPDVSQDFILERLESGCTRLRDLFRGKERAGHRAWGRLVIRGATRGTYRLSSPNSGQ